jgi:hypothetical protein
MEKLKPEKAVEMLRSRGVDISVEQAVQMLELLQKFAAVIVAQQLENSTPSILRKAI